MILLLYVSAILDLVSAWPRYGMFDPESLGTNDIREIFGEVSSHSKTELNKNMIYKSLEGNKLHSTNSSKLMFFTKNIGRCWSFRSGKNSLYVITSGKPFEDWAWCSARNRGWILNDGDSWDAKCEYFLRIFS